MVVRVHHGGAAKKKPVTPQTNKIVVNSYVPGVLTTAFSMREMVETVCNFRRARKLFLSVVTVNDTEIV